jgi:hypothetical protein
MRPLPIWSKQGEFSVHCRPSGGILILRPVSLFYAFILALGRIEYDRRRNIPHGFGYGLDYGLWLP